MYLLNSALGEKYLRMILATKCVYDLSYNFSLSAVKAHYRLENYSVYNREVVANVYDRRLIHIMTDLHQLPIFMTHNYIVHISTAFLVSRSKGPWMTDGSKKTAPGANMVKIISNYLPISLS